MKTKVLLFLVALIVVLAGFTFAKARKIFTPTTGPRIARYSNPARALLVVDLQEDYTGLKGKQPPLFPSAAVQISIINKLIERASTSGTLVVYIQHLFSNNFFTRTFLGRTIEGLPGSEIDARVKVINGNIFTKKISDAFSNPRLEELLIAHQVDDLTLVGLDAAYCVHKTALGAINRGYRVSVITDAVLTSKDMNKVLEQYAKDGIRQVLSKDFQ